MKDTYYVTSECVTTQIVPMDDKSGMDGSGQMQFDIIETVFQVRSKPNGENLSQQDLEDMTQKPDGNMSDNPLEMPISPSKTSALSQISGDNDKISIESDVSQEMPMTPSETTASSPKTSGDNLANLERKKGEKGKMMMYIDRDFDTNFGLCEDGSKMVTKDCKEIVSCYKVINEAAGTKEDKPTIVIDRRQTEKTVTFNDNTQETLILRKETITYPADYSYGRDEAPTKEDIGPSSATKSPKQVSGQPKSEAVTVTAYDSSVQLADPKNLELFKKKTKPGTNVAQEAHGEIVIIETYEVLVENLLDCLGPRKNENSKGEMPEPKHGVPNNVTGQSARPGADMDSKWKPEMEKKDMGKKEMQEFVTIETTEVVVEVLEYQPSSHGPSGNSSAEMSKGKTESSPINHSRLSGKSGSKKNERPELEKPELHHTMETLTVEISEFVIQKIEQ